MTEVHLSSFNTGNFNKGAGIFVMKSTFFNFCSISLYRFLEVFELLF